MELNILLLKQNIFIIPILTNDFVYTVSEVVFHKGINGLLLDLFVATVSLKNGASASLNEAEFAKRSAERN